MINQILIIPGVGAASSVHPLCDIKMFSLLFIEGDSPVKGTYCKFLCLTPTSNFSELTKALKRTLRFNCYIFMTRTHIC